jgi:catechol 2,3-dioxygenase-like lactoylglutathione lyase family enzyme
MLERKMAMITGIGHAAFRVTNLQQALDFYCNKLGFVEAFRLDQEGQPSPWIVYVQIAPGSFIELFPDPQDAPGTMPAQDPQASYKHICLLVDDMETTLHQLQERGLPISGSPIKGLDSNLQYWLKDPDGNPIELMQITPNSPQAAADARMQSNVG